MRSPTSAAVACTSEEDDDRILDERYLTRTGDHILCAGHGGLFTLDGAGATTPCLGLHLTPWQVEVRDGEVVTV